ncbi:WD domain, G-beta repeat [Carpediemonas membranifera]|uniref:methylated diphthine methylhydrolase n=1 Tax=Carpediemonas membranifera TaxID=201153 RepID=A0A8J6BY63_9EUKA|nr:WD domain, G-beta repeat [Carpediemonas membranifera]|eukprot:KAG9394176.1 WD domain, G-beta repeat [Carpediemonas membranifera]
MAVLHDTVEPSDCIDSIQLSDGRWIVAIGTYLLNKSDGTRSGRIYLGIGDLFDATDYTAVDGVFDLRFYRINGIIRLVVADCLGRLTIYTMAEAPLALHKESSVQMHEGLAFHISFDGNTFITTGSDGCVAIAALDKQTLALERQASWKAHDYDPWCCIHSEADPNQLLTGGDDCALKVWDQRCPEVVLKSSMAHGAGVTCMTWVGGELVTGSYDGVIRIFDIRRIGYERDSISTEAGVWRCRPSPTDPSTLAVANMHAGFSKASLASMSVVSQYKAHGVGVEGAEVGLGYGVAWLGEIVGCVSFYDHTFSLWDECGQDC